MLLKNYSNKIAILSVCGVLVSIVIVLNLAGCHQEKSVAPSGKAIKVGILGPMAAPIGDKGLKGVKTAQLIEPYTISGDRIEIDVFDDHSKPNEAKKLYQAMAKNPEFKSVIVLSTSKTMLPLSHGANQYKLPMIGTIATHPDITRISNYVGRVCFSDDRQGRVAAIYVRDELLIDRVAIIYDDQDPYSRNLKNTFRTSFRAVGGDAKTVINIREVRESITEYLLELREQDVQLLYLIVNAGDTIEIAKALENIDWQVKKMGDGGILAVVTHRLKDNIDLLDGFLATDFISTGLQLTELGQKGLETYLEHFSTPDSYTALGFEAYFLVKHALDSCSPDYAPDCVAANIRNVNTFTGVSGKYSIKDGDSLRPVMVNEIENGRFKLLVKVY